MRSRPLATFLARQGWRPSASMHAGQEQRRHRFLERMCSCVCPQGLTARKDSCPPAWIPDQVWPGQRIPWTESGFADAGRVSARSKSLSSGRFLGIKVVLKRWSQLHKRDLAVPGSFWFTAVQARTHVSECRYAGKSAASLRPPPLRMQLTRLKLNLSMVWRRESVMKLSRRRRGSDDDASRACDGDLGSKGRWLVP